MSERSIHLYHGDDGNDYRVLINSWVASYTSNPFGYSADDPSKQALPRYIKKRYVTLKDAVSGRHRKVACGTVGCSAYATLSTSFTLPNIDGTSSSYTSDGRVGEKTRGVI
jgi:hypothetical protein